jgi:flagella basal body P-ring formation protein FlgA
MRSAHLLTAVLLLPVAAWAGSVTLKANPYVKGPTICLGDIAEINAENAERLSRIELGPAALPGSVKRLDAAVVTARIEHAGLALDALELEGADAIHVTTLHLEVSGRMLAEDLRAHILATMPWDPKDTLVEVDPPSGDFVLPDGDVSIRWHPSSQFNYLGSGVFRGELCVDGQTQKTVLCRAHIETYGDVVVAVVDIPRGEPIRPADLALEKKPRSSLRGAPFGEPSGLDGYVAGSTLYPGQVITRQQVKPRRIIKRNQIVAIELRRGGLVVRSRAKAKNDACEGDVLRCQNLESKEEFEGIVQKDGLVALE